MKLFFLLISFSFIWNVSISQIILTEHEHTAYTPTRDTLWIKNGPTGNLIKDSWNFTNSISFENRPVIIMVDDFADIRKKYIIQKNKKS